MNSVLYPHFAYLLHFHRKMFLQIYLTYIQGIKSKAIYILIHRIQISGIIWARGLKLNSKI